MQSLAKKQLTIRLIAIAGAVIVLGLIINYAVTARGRKPVPVKKLKTPQQAAPPLGFPLDEKGTLPPFDPRFIQLTAFERAKIPTITRTAAAMGSEHGALTYNAQRYWHDNAKRGGHHTGDDINGIGGMNTDLGDPVRAIANGLVIYRGEPSPGWGNTLILAHRTKDGQILLSMYAHLHTLRAAYGELVPLGKSIGTCGTANQNYPAHLHLEMRDATGIDIGYGYVKTIGETIDPQPIIARHQPKDPTLLHPTPLTIMQAKLKKLRRAELIINHAPAKK